MDLSSHLPPWEGALEWHPPCTVILGTLEGFPGAEYRERGGKASLPPPPLPTRAWGVCRAPPERQGLARSVRSSVPLGEGAVPGPCLLLTVPCPAESWPSCLSTCNGPATGAYGPWRCGGRQYPTERPPVTRPLPPATGRAAPTSALGKGRGPPGLPPPLASPPPLPFFVSSSLRPASSHYVGVWACAGDSQALS